MKKSWVQGVVALFLLWVGQPAAGEGLRATLSLEHDDNPFERTAMSRKTGWVNRLFLYSSGQLLQTSRTALQVRHQWGLKRFWKAEEADGARGDVVASQLEITGLMRVHERVVAGLGSEVKIKNVQRVSSEESYLHGALRLSLKSRLGRGFSGVVQYRRSGDDARHESFVDVSLHEVGIEMGWGRSRRLRGRLGLVWRFLDYDRPALVQEEGGGLSVGSRDQSDRGREVVAGVQVYRGALVHATYVLLDTRSNSVGYGFRAHRLQVLVTRPIAARVDGQVYLNLQRRRYDEELPEPLPEGGAEEDEYEQNLISLRLSHQMSERYGLSWEYRRARNGSRQSEDSYRKNIFALALDMKL